MLSTLVEHTRSHPHAAALRAARHEVHELYARAERAGLLELASALWTMEEALHAMLNGELSTEPRSWRQIEAALRAGQVACDAKVDAGSAAPTSAGRVLMLDADSEFVGEVERAAAKKRLELVRVEYPGSALDALRAQRINAIVLVVSDGATLSSDLVSHLRVDGSEHEPPLVVVARQGDLAMRLQAARAGASLFLTKPLRPEALVDAVQSLVTAQNAPPVRVLALAEPTLQAELEHCLAPAGIRVLRSGRPQDVGEQLESDRPDLLLIGQRVAGESGVDLCRIVRCMPKWQDLPIVLFSDQPDPSGAREFAAGADDCLPADAIGPRLLPLVRARVQRTRLFREQSSQDSLTGLLTRRAFGDVLSARLAEAERFKKHVSLCLIDLDRFKSINDTYGHAVGDRVLGAFGRLLLSRFRTEDLRGRWGGEEFAVAFFGEWGQSAREILSRATSEFSRMVFRGDANAPFQVTVSAGIATFPIDGRTVDDLMLAADRRLYDAKRAGRNRIRI